MLHNTLIYINIIIALWHIFGRHTHTYYAIIRPRCKYLWCEYANTPRTHVLFPASTPLWLYNERVELTTLRGEKVTSKIILY